MTSTTYAHLQCIAFKLLLLFFKSILFSYIHCCGLQYDTYLYLYIYNRKFRYIQNSTIILPQIKSHIWDSSPLKDWHVRSSHEQKKRKEEEQLKKLKLAICLKAMV